MVESRDGNRLSKNPESTGSKGHIRHIRQNKTESYHRRMRVKGSRTRNIAGRVYKRSRRYKKK